MESCQPVIDERLRTLRRNRALCMFALSLLLTAAIVLLLFSVVLGIARVEGDSMYPTFCDGDYVVYHRLAKDPTVGSIVAFHDDQGVRYIKRVAAVSGDTVYEAAASQGSGTDETKAFWTNASAHTCVIPQSQNIAAQRYPYEIPESCIFALGDNRAVSLDSRTMGAIPKSAVDGVILMTIRV